MPFHSVPSPARSLIWTCVLVFAAYMVIVWVLWQVGIEAIYRHPTPFYAVFLPVFTASGTSLVAVIFLAGAGAWSWASSRSDWWGEGPSEKTARYWVCGLIAFAFLFAGAVAMMRGGSTGISQAYARTTYEYIGDIGLGGSLRGLFQDYNRIHPYLSMHSKVHPPGPIAILWVLSYAAGRSALGLSIATMALGSLAIAPLYGWVSDLFSRRVALTACALYSLVPSIVLFTATSADIAFMPFTLATLFLFGRAIQRGSIFYAAAAGAGYAAMTLISFSLAGLGVFFALAGLLQFGTARGRWRTVKTAAVMLAAFLAFHGGVWLWSGFDIIECFHLARTQFDLDQTHLDQITPRYPSWTWKFLNPAAWFFFAGIPVSVLFVQRLARPGSSSKNLFLVFGLTLAACDILYLARGEGERSAMYIMPFLVVPAAHLLDRLAAGARSQKALLAACAFLAAQCWFIESIFYTYW